jgi:hypothetical protein
MISYVKLKNNKINLKKMENTYFEENNNQKFIESIDHLLLQTKAHFSLLKQPFSDLEDKVSSTNSFLNHFFKVLATGFASLSNKIEISNFLHLMTIKNLIGLEN